MMSTFAIRVEPQMPVLLGRRLNLCGLLAHRLVERLISKGVEQDEAIRRGNSEIPLAQSHGVFAGSSALIQRCVVTSFSISGSFERHLLAIPEPETIIARNEMKRKNSRPFDMVAARYGNLFNTYDQHHVNGVDGGGIWFMAHGDRPAVESLLSGLKRIGAKRRPVVSVTFYDAESSELPGIVGHDGTLLRPVPCSSGFTPPGKFATAEETFRPPYWNGARQMCYVPPSLMWDSVGRIRHAIGVV